MNTALTNRLGDYFIFCFFSRSFFYSFYFFSFRYLYRLGLFFLVLSSFTKSAQFPFSSWLPKAIRAPTPISSLVHSRTLVTAGLILLLNFDFLIFNYYLMVFMLLFGLFTMGFSRVVAMFEEDMKKVVALSTLSQIGFMVFTLGLGLHFVSFLHLLRHALFKSCLFMQVGYLIHRRFGQQDGRYYGNNGNLSMCVQLQLLTTLFCLCGLVFTRGIVSKDLILEFFFFNRFRFFLRFFFLLFVFLTFGYRYRLWKSFFFNFSKVLVEFGGGLLMNFLSLFLVVFSVVFIYWIRVNLFCLPCLFLFVDFYIPLLYIFLIMIFSYIVFKLLCKELAYKFFVDYFSKYFSKGGVRFKFFDFGLIGFGLDFFSMFNGLGKLFGLLIGSIGFNRVVIVIFLVFLFLWDLSLIKNI